MYKSYNWNTLKRHSAFDDLMRVSECILFHNKTGNSFVSIQ